jgi:hypothetical protein
MRALGVAAIALFLFTHTAVADPVWSQIGFATTASNAPKVVAAADKMLSSEVGKQFPGRLLLQANVADGANPATHTWVPIYKSAAEGEAWVQKLQQSPAWTQFLGDLEKNTTPVSTVRNNVIKSWGDLVDTDQVWMAHSFDVTDGAAFLAAIDKLMASETGKKFPGQVYLSAVVAGGLSPVSHIISVGYDSEAEMAAWNQTVQGSKDWTAYTDATATVSEYLGGSLARTLKAWGPATLKQLSMP